MCGSTGEVGKTWYFVYSGSWVLGEQRDIL